MHKPLLDLSAFITTYAFFGAVGYPFARKFRTPVATGTWVALCAGVVILGFSWLGETWLFAVDGFHIYLSNAVHAVIIGMLVGLIVREMERRRAKREST